MADQAYGWSKEDQRFRDLSTGRWVSERAVRDAVDRVADLAARRMGESAARLRAGTIDIPAWIAESQQVIKSSQIAASLAAYGGRQNMTSETWGYVGFRVREQYAYLNRMAADILDGRQRLNGRLEARSRMYGGAARQTFTNIRRREAARSGQAFERNVLGAAEHCGQCVGETARGWVTIGSLVPPGSRTCRGNCRCSLAYARTFSEAAA